MRNTLERAYRSQSELADAILDNEGGVLRELLEGDPEPLIAAVLASTDADDLIDRIRAAQQAVADNQAAYLWDTQAHIYRASASELREMDGYSLDVLFAEPMAAFNALTFRAAA